MEVLTVVMHKEAIGSRVGLTLASATADDPPTVSSVVQGSLAAKAGLHQGDVLLAISGMLVSNPKPVLVCYAPKDRLTYG